MKRVLQALEKINKLPLKEMPYQEGYDQVFDWLTEIDFAQVDITGYEPPDPAADNYSKRVIQMNPFEAVLIHWPAGMESAVHLHQGFWGFVAVVQGKLENYEYHLENRQLKEWRVTEGIPGALLQEPDGVIHKLVNPSSTESAVTIHFYYPPLESYEGMKIFDLENCRLGILNDQANTASWVEPESSFKKITEQAFKFLALDEYRTSSHYIHPVIPKPASEAIRKGLSAYYSEQAHQYDFFDLQHEMRRKYTEKINELIAREIRINHSDTQNFLALACGTGRRITEIREQVGFHFSVLGVDLSAEMANVAKNRGIETLVGDWLEVDLNGELYDGATFLYAFGHLESSEVRRRSLKKVLNSIRPGAPVFFDVFNLEDKNEWGGRANTYYREQSLHRFGYERGDVFYKKSGGEAVAFLHYFTEEEVRSALEDVGFEVAWIKHIGYAKKSGMVLETKNEGSLFVKAIKPK
ncbi:methyltransferase domain-containing protein [bacterium SCSIO 12741]|nr:methyltransferase domain-containing protein [bacterium SCSIO 12741]